MMEDSKKQNLIDDHYYTTKAICSFPPQRVSDYPFTGKFLPPAVELPKVKGDLLSETTMRNLMGFELCFGSTFMDRAMINYVQSDKDVAVLRESGILYNERGRDKKVAQMWNNLCDSTCRDA
eukprot:Gb_02619 [translate_table: standard]